MADLRWVVLLAIVSMVLGESMSQSERTSGVDDKEEIDEELRKLMERRKNRLSPPTPDCNLRVYDADTEGHLVKEWHDLVKTPIDEKTALRQLLIESCEDDEKLATMCASFLTARIENKCVAGLTKAECVAVSMYTIEESSFYREYNNASAYGTWSPYKVYTTLLLSAVKKLSVIEPIPLDTRLYRGMSIVCRAPQAKKIFWKTFTSTSLDEEVASYFGSGTTLVFEPQATVFGARIRNLSLLEMEDEVLIPPFEMFEFVKADEQTFYFAASMTQDLLLDEHDKHRPLFGLITTTTTQEMMETSETEADLTTASTTPDAGGERRAPVVATASKTVDLNASADRRTSTTMTTALPIVFTTLFAIWLQTHQTTSG